jgi:hypothetical protein
MVQIKVCNKQDKDGRSSQSSSEAPLLGELQVVTDNTYMQTLFKHASQLNSTNTGTITAGDSMIG